jgi:hypothetical protein
MGVIKYGKQSPKSDFDRRSCDKNTPGKVSITCGTGKLGGSNGNAAKQSKKQGTGRGQ